MTIVVLHFAMLTMLWIDKFQFHKELTAIAYAYRKGIGSGKEIVQSLFSFFVIEQGTCPTFGTTQDI